MKVNDLEGIELDYWVARAEGLNVRIWGSRVVQNGGMGDSIQYAIDWNFIGKIIERDGVYVESTDHSDGPPWEADQSFGKTALEAIKRCLVKRKYGEEVES